jgi:hypothetical protein
VDGIDQLLLTKTQNRETFWRNSMRLILVTLVFLSCHSSLADDISIGENFERTRSGVLYSRDYSLPFLGRAWVDPRGVIWGDAVTSEFGEVTMYFNEADEYCRANGARLPLCGEFELAAQDMGKGTEAGYMPQVLPRLRDGVFWCRIPDRFCDPRARHWWFYSGDTGDFGYIQKITATSKKNVRCVSNLD